MKQTPRMNGSSKVVPLSLAKKRKIPAKKAKSNFPILDYRYEESKLPAIGLHDRKRMDFMVPRHLATLSGNSGKFDFHNRKRN